MTQSSYDILRPDLPAELADLHALALDLRWSWSHVADDLWRYIDEDLWYQTQNPWLMLQTVSRAHLQALATDSQFLELLQAMREEQLTAQQAQGWIEPSFPGLAPPEVAYFSMEFGISEALPIYSGGLGVLAGDHLKSSGESGLSLTGIGLLYQQGYFRQGLDAEGHQLAFFPYNDPTQLPVIPARDEEGEWLQVSVSFPGRDVILRLWKAQIGRIELILLDSNTPLNTPADRGITSELYGGGSEMRLQQEIVLGVGGYRAVRALNITPDVCHLNEGHAAFVVLERAREFMSQAKCSFEVALTATRAGNLFTTHTPVDAGFDRFTPALFCQYMKHYAAELQLDCQSLLHLGRFTDDNEQALFNMALLATHGSAAVNAVSRLHQSVSQRLFRHLYPRWPLTEVPVDHITNGIHVPTWDSEIADDMWTRYCGKERWHKPRNDLEQIVQGIDDKTLWDMRTRNRMTLINWLRKRLTCQQSLGYLPNEQPRDFDQILDPNALTLGFARRFATYKRPNLLLQDRDRLAQLLTMSDKPVQLVIAGKAHPRDLEGQEMIRQWIAFIRDYRMQARVIFVVDYDLTVSKHLVQGVDLWINTPRRPWEASGTSGMKVLVNGGINLSELDGWWAEAWSPQVGYKLGDGREHGPEHDRAEALELYELLERRVIPEFYNRDEQGIPVGWVSLIRESMAQLTPVFSTNRMVQEYYRKYYEPLTEAYQHRIADSGRRAQEICHWQAKLETHWEAIHLGNIEAIKENDQLIFTAQVYLDDLSPADVEVQLYADSRADSPGFCETMERVEALSGAINGFRYRTSTKTDRPQNDFTIRVIPHHPEVEIPLESSHILWQK